MLTIGAFARASRLSVKALRLYEQHALLTPHTVDDHNGYRYYHPDQLARAQLIARLREIDVPLERVGSVLAAEDHAEAVRRLAFWWAGQEHITRVRRDLVQSLRTDLVPGPAGAHPAGDGPAWQVSHASSPERLVVSEQRNTTVDQLPAFIADAIERLRSTTGITPDAESPVMVIYHGRVNIDSDGPVEVCLALHPASELAVSDLTAGTNMRREDAQREVRITLTKTQVVYPDILAAYDHLERHIAARSETAAGPPREYYFADLHAAKPDQPVCHAAIPIA